MWLAPHSRLIDVIGHFRLWEFKVEHNDISVTNLMYDKANDNKGVLNDFDLAHLCGYEWPSGTECTGTMPFMVLDLLTDAGWAGQVEHIYWHDHESFTWVLLWICASFDNGKEVHPLPLEAWLSVDHGTCFKEKLSILSLLQQ